MAVVGRKKKYLLGDHSQRNKACGDWDMHVEPSSGKSYWHNRNSGETMWSDDWEKHVDAASGLPYFYNAKTGESKWANIGSNAAQQYSNAMYAGGQNLPGVSTLRMRQSSSVRRKV